MKTIKTNGVLAICGLLIACLSVACLSASYQSGEKRYEVRPEITIPESKTDVARMVDAYERLMDNYKELMESHLTGIHTEVGTIDKKLDAIDRKMSVLSAQLETIQKKLGIEPTPQQPEKPISAKDPNRTDDTGAEKQK